MKVARNDVPPRRIPPTTGTERTPRDRVPRGEPPPVPIRAGQVDFASLSSTVFV
jgi:hypothetical protein